MTHDPNNATEARTHVHGGWNVAADRLIVASLRAARAKIKRGEGATLGDLMLPLGPRMAAIGSALLALPFIVPVSLGPLSAPASAMILVFGFALLANAFSREKLEHKGDAEPEITDAATQTRDALIGSWTKIISKIPMPPKWRAKLVLLPTKLFSIPVSETIVNFMGGMMKRTYRWKRKLVRPRLLVLVDGAKGEAIAALGLIVGAILLAVPLPLVPLGNTFPALAILFFAAGWSERDGVLTVLGIFFLLVTVVYFGILLLLGKAALEFIWGFFGFTPPPADTPAPTVIPSPTPTPAI